jgi:RNA polymerase sigma factor (sigma-70 family)
MKNRNDLITEYINSNNKLDFDTINIKEDIIKAYLPDIYRLAYSRTRNSSLWDDMVSYGLSALSDCLDHYDPAKNNNFWGYAYSSIIRSFLFANASQSGNPTRRVDQSRLVKAINKLKAEGKSLSYEALDELTGRGVVYITNLIYPQTIEDFKPELDPRYQKSAQPVEMARVYDEVEEFIWVDSLRSMLTDDLLGIMNDLLDGKEKAQIMEERGLSKSKYNVMLLKIKAALRSLQQI